MAENLKATGKGFCLKKQKMTRKLGKTCGLFKEIPFIVITMNLQFKLHVPREESFPIPLKYIDVIRSTHTDLDVAQEKRIDDCWNVDGNTNLSDSWTGFTRFTLLNETPPREYLWSWRRLTKIQTTPRPDDAWTRIGKAAQRREKQEGAIEKPKLEHARKLTGVKSIDPSDEEYKDIIKNARRKLDTPVAAAMPCKRAFSQASIREAGVSKTGKGKTSEAKTRFRNNNKESPLCCIDGHPPHPKVRVHPGECSPEQSQVWT